MERKKGEKKGINMEPQMAGKMHTLWSANSAAIFSFSLLNHSTVSFKARAATQC